MNQNSHRELQHRAPEGDSKESREESQRYHQNHWPTSWPLTTHTLRVHPKGILKRYSPGPCRYAGRLARIVNSVPLVNSRSSRPCMNTEPAPVPAPIAAPMAAPFPPPAIA